MKIPQYFFLYGLRLLVFLPLFYLSFFASAQVTITVATGGESVCLNSGPSTSDYYNLGDIVITENSDDDILNGNNISEFIDLAFIGGSFEFEAGVGTLSISSPGGYINASLLTVTSTGISIGFNFNGLARNEINVIRVSGLRVRATAIGSAEIERIDEGFGDNLPLNGDAPLGGISHGSLNAYNPPIPILTNDKGSSICETETITFSGLPGTASKYEFIYDTYGIRASMQSGPSGIYSTSSIPTPGQNMSVIVTDDHGCAVETAGQWIDVSPGFTTSLTSDAISNTSCQGTEVIFDANPGGIPVGTVNYQFFVNHVSVQASSTDDTYYVSSLVDGDEIFVIATDDNCAPTSNTISQTIYLPDIGLSVTPLSSTISTGASANITVGASELNVDYQLQNNVDSSPLSATFSGTGSDLLLTSSALTANVTIKVVATSTGLPAGCISTLSDVEVITVTVPTTDPPDANDPAPICAGEATPALTATGPNLTWYSDAGLTVVEHTGASAYTPLITEVNNAVAGTYTLYVTQNPGAESAAAEVDVVVNPLPNVGLAVSPAAINVCKNLSTTITIASSESGFQYQLFNSVADTALSAIYVGDGGAIEIPAFPLSSDLIIKVKATNTSLCESDLTNTTAVTIDEPPSIADAGTGSINQCSDGDFTMIAIAPAIGLGTWTLYSGTATLPGGTLDNSPTAAITGVPVGTNAKLYWTVSNGVCPDNVDNITLRNREQPIAEAGIATAGECDLDIQLLGVRSVTGTDISWAVTAGNAGDITFSDNTLVNPIATSTVYGTYTFTMTEIKNNCNSTDNIIVSFFETPATSAAGSDQGQCNNGTFALLGNDVSASPGTGLWTIEGAANGAVITTPTDFNSGVTGLTEGNSITLRWTISNGTCTDSYDELILTNNVAVTAGITTSEYNGFDISCNGASDGYIQATAAGGTGDYTFTLGGDVSAAQTQPGATFRFPVLSAGNYTIDVSNENGCSIAAPVPIALTEPVALTASGAVTSNYNGSEVSCAGSSNGELTVTASDGEGTYSYVLNELPGNTTGDLVGIYTGLPAGSYTITITDGNGCSVTTTSATIDNPPTITASLAGTDNSCFNANDGTVTATGAGGTGAYTYDLEDNLGNPVANVTGDGTGIYTDLSAGSYQVVVSDLNSCPATSNVIIISNPAAVTSGNTTSDYGGFDIGCNGGSDGYIEVTAGGGTGDYTFTLAGPSGGVQTQPGVSYRFNGLGAGAYTIDVNDAKTCSATQLNVTLTEPVALTASGAVTSNYNGSEVSCNGDNDGVLTITARDGSGGYSYVLNELLINTTGNINGIYTGLLAGSYTVTVTDGNGCSATTTSETIDNPPTIIASLVATDMSCFGVEDGTVKATAGGGTGAYTYDLEDDFGFALANTTGDGTGIYTGLSAGSYQMVVTDVNGCSVTSNSAIVVDPPLATFTILSNPVSPGAINSGEKTDIDIQMPIPGGTVSLSNITVSDIRISGNSSVGAFYSDGFKLQDALLNSSNNIEWIEYEFTGILNGCINPATQTVRLDVNPAPQISVLNFKSEICSGEAVDIEVNSLTINSIAELKNVTVSPDTGGITGFLPVGTKWFSASSQLPAVIADPLINTTNHVQTITYEVEMSASSYITTSTRFIEVIVNPTPLMTIINTNTLINSGEFTDILINTPTQNAYVKLKSVNTSDAGLTGNSTIGASFPGATTLADLLINNTFSPQTITYEFEAGGNACVNPATIFADVLVNPSPEMTITNNNLVICSGEAIDLNLSSTTADATVELIAVTVSPDAGGVAGFSPLGTTWQSSLSQLPGTLVDNLVNSTDKIQTISYEFEISAGGFVSTTTKVTEIKVNPTPSMTIFNASGFINSGSPTNILIYVPTENGQVLLKSINKTDPSLTGNTGVDVLFQNATVLEDVLLVSSLSPQTITYEFEARGGGCVSLSTRSTDVVINPVPEMTITNNSPVICSDEAASLLISSATSDAIITLVGVTVSPGAGSVTGFTPVNTTWASALSELPVLLTDNLNNPTSGIQTITYEFSVQASGFVVRPNQSVSVSVNPTPQMTITNTNTTINSGELTDIFIETLTENGQVRIKNINTTDPGLTGNSTVGALFPNNTLLEDIVFNSSINPQTITYEFEAVGNACVNTSTETANVLVIPTPELTIDNNTSVICSEEITNIDISSVTANTTLELISVSTSPNVGSVTGYTPVSSTWESSLDELPVLITDNLVNTTHNIQTIAYTFEASAIGFTGTTIKKATIIVNPTPQMTINNIDTIVNSGYLTDILISTPTENGQVYLKNVLRDLSLDGNTGVGASFPDGHRIEDLIVNSSNSNQTITYEFEARGNSCANPGLITEAVLVIPITQMSLTNNTPILCSTERTDIAFSSPTDDAIIELVDVIVSPNAGSVAGITPLNTTWNTFPATIRDDLVNPSSATQYVEYVFEMSTSGYANPTTQSVIVEVRPLPDVQAFGAGICSGDQTNINIINPNAVNFTRYNWLTFSSGSVTGESNGSGNKISQQLNNSSTSLDTVVYRIYSTAQSCAGDSIDLIQLVHPNNIAFAGSDVEVCQGTPSIDIHSASIGGSATGILWTQLNGNGVLSNVNALTPTYTPSTIPSNEAGTINLQLTASDTSVCSSTTDVVSIIINSLPVAGFDGLEISYQADDSISTLVGVPDDLVKGIFSGPGVLFDVSKNAYTFSPVVSDSGTHVIRYTYEDDNSCVSIIEKTTIVHALPNVEIGDPDPYCLGSEPLDYKLPRTQRAGFKDSWGGENIFLLEGEYYFHPRAVKVHTVTYTLEETSTGAMVTENKYIRVNDVPRINFGVENNCISDSIKFVDSSYFDNANVFMDSITSWKWEIPNEPDFADSLVQNPLNLFDKASAYQVILTATSRFNCSASLMDTIMIGAVPIPAFSGTNLTTSEVSEFADMTRFPTVDSDPLDGYIDPTTSVDSIWWDFGEPTPIAGLHPADSIVTHPFANAGNYIVKMRIKTNWGCYAETMDPISLLPSINTYPYVQNFDNFIIPPYQGVNSSWKKMVPNGEIIVGEPGNVAWVTYASDSTSYNDNEKSFVTLPSFDLRPLKRPMLSLDIWSNTEKTRDGAVLQYSSDGKEWFTLVDPNENLAADSKDQIGLNWYNEKGIVSQPGDGMLGSVRGENPGGYGWTGTDKRWRTARFPLDTLYNIPNLSSVRFRVAFSSDEKNPALPSYEGFAFDNLWIGEREHNVLLEHFDNLAGKHVFDDVNKLAQRFGLDLIPIQYHNNNPSEDIIYQNNSYPVETRGSIYNINESPRSFLDGMREYNYSGDSIEHYQIINQSLEDPLFDINIDVIPTDTVSKVYIRVTITANYTISDEIIVNVMPVETSISGASIGSDTGIDSLNNVVKDMLPAGGYPYYESWVQGMSRSFTVPWDVTQRTIYDKSKLGVVVFVQNDLNEGIREVYQTEFAKLPELEQSAVITGIEDELNVRKFEVANIYPNPAENQFTVALSEYLTKELDWSIIDQRGVQLLEGTFIAGEDSFEIDAQRLPVGLHMFIVTSGTEYKTIRKIIINR